MVKILTVWSTVLAAAAMAQIPDDRCCRLIASLASDSPTSVKLTLVNLSDQALSLQFAAVFDSYEIVAQGPDGKEPPRTALGDSIKSKDGLGGFGQKRKTLRKHEIIDQQFDLAYLWTFSEGTYKIGFRRNVNLGRQVVSLKAEVMLQVPFGFVSDRGCAPERRMQDAAYRTGGLKGEDFASPDGVLRDVLARKVEFLRSATSHNLVGALVDALIGAQVSGGMAVTNENSRLPACVLVGDSLRDLIARVQSKTAELSIDGRAQSLNILDSSTSDFLETKLNTIVLPSPIWAADAAISAVLATPEMIARSKALALEDAGPIQPSMSDRARERADREGSLTLKNPTAREALNAIVEKLNCGVWVYTEWEIGSGRRAFKIELFRQSTNQR